jgi:hypothetical protein
MPPTLSRKSFNWTRTSPGPTTSCAWRACKAKKEKGVRDFLPKKVPDTFFARPVLDILLGVSQESKRTLAGRSAMPKGRDKVTIKIPRELYRRLQEMLKGTGFGSVTEFIVYVMRDLASGGRLERQEGLTSQEVDLIRKRLKALGYLD